MFLRLTGNAAFRLFAGIGLTLCFSHAGNAQLLLEEIVVTAQKRAQNLQDVPISVLAVSGEEISRQGFKRLEDVTSLMPNVTVTEAALGDQLFIRGIGSGLNIGFEQSVGTFIDGVYFGRGLQSRNIFLDIERVEVLRGPQSTFFGNNAIAGAMSITTRGPTDAWEGYLSGLYEDGIGAKSIDVATGGPISDTLGIRFAGRYADQDGWQTNSTINDKEPREERLAGRITVEWAPSEVFDASLKYQVESNDVEGRAMQAVACPPEDGQPPAGYCLGYGVLGPALVPGTPVPDFIFDERRNGGNGTSPFPTNEDFNDLENRSGSLTLNWDVSGHIITAITGYSKYEDHRSQSGILLAGPFPAPIIPFANIEHVQEDFKQYSQEFRITSPTGGTIEYLAGVYFQGSELNVKNDFSAATFATRLSQHDQDEDTIAAFGSLTWHINEQLRLALGLRYTDVSKDVRREQVLATNQGNLVLGNAIPMTPANPFFGAFVFGFQWQNGVLEASRSDDDLSPSFNIQYDFNDETMAYASYAAGFKAGGFDEQNGRLDPESFGFRPETVDAFELGAKTRLADGAMTLNAAIFRNEFTDLQVQTFDGVINFLVSNAASSVTQGAELDISWQLSDSLLLDFHGAYLDATYDDRKNGQCTTTQTAGLAPGCNFSDPLNPRQDLTGARLPYAPEISGNIGLTHLYKFSNDYSLRTNATLLFSDDFNTVDDNDPFLTQDSFTKFDATITLSNPDNTWEVSLIGRNLFDEQTSSAGNDLPLSAGSYFRFLDKPRTIAIQARYNWN